MARKNRKAELEKQIRVLVVDQQPVVRLGLEGILSEQPDLIMCGWADDVAGALEKVEGLNPGLMITEVVLNNSSGLDLVKKLRERRPGLPILVLSTLDEAFYAERALRAGARGYVCKTEPCATITRAVRMVLEGQVYVSLQTASRLLQTLVCGCSEKDPIERLSDCEMEIFRMIGQGLSTRQIAGRIHISMNTAKSHRAHIQAKMMLPDAAALVREAILWNQGRSK